MAAETFRIEIPIRVDDQTDPGVSQAKQKLNGFDKAAQKTQERLNQMNRAKYQIVLDALDRASHIIGNVSSRVRGIAGRTFSFSLKVLDFATAPLRGIWNFATSIQGAILGAGGAFAGIFKPMELAGNYEQLQIAFKTMLGSAEKAKSFLNDVTNFANDTPFEFPELAESSKLLLSFGFESERILDIMRTIGDTTSGLSAGAAGIDRITRALGQMQAKGRLQTEELLQLQELGVPANQILQEELGLTREQIANIGNESIDAAKAIDALLRGMDKRYGGLMGEQARSALGLLSTIRDNFKSKLLRPWGEGLWGGVKPGLSKITTWLDENQEIITAWGEAWKEAGANISKWVVSKVESLRDSIQKMTNSQEWKDAKNFGSKMKIAWNTIIAEPFMAWWNSTGKAWLADKASKIGEGIGGAISAGLLALLGVNVSGAVEDGTSIGAAFASGFQKGFDGKKVGEAILNVIKGVFSDAGTLLPGGEKASSTSWLSAGAIGLVLAKLGVFKLLGKGGKGLLNMFGKGSKSALPQATGSALGDSWSTSVMYVSASVVYLSGPTFGGLLGLGSAGIDIFQGSKASKAGDTKGAKDEYVTAGTKASMVGTGAAIGAGIGAIFGGVGAAPGALIGAGVGGVASLFAGNKAGKALSDASDPGGWLSNAGAAISKWSGGAWDSLKKGASDAGSWIADKWSGVSDWFGTSVWTPIKDVGISAINITAGIWSGVRDVISDKWSDLSGWFDTNVWQPVSGAAQVAAQWLNDRWSEVSGWVRDRWGEFSGWFGDNVWTPVKNGAQTAASWLKITGIRLRIVELDRLPYLPGFHNHFFKAGNGDCLCGSGRRRFFYHIRSGYGGNNRNASTSTVNETSTDISVASDIGSGTGTSREARTDHHANNNENRSKTDRRRNPNNITFANNITSSAYVHMYKHRIPRPTR